MMTGVTGQGDMSAKQSLYEVVARWNVETGDGLADLIHAACVALSDGLDSPALRDLAAASAEDSSWAVRRLVGQALEELDIPQPGTVAPGGGTAGGPGVDSLRLEVARVRGEHAGGGFQVLVYVNDVEMTAAGAGLGMDPYDVLVPTNRLVATAEPHTVPIARCGCGVYGCGSTDVTLVRAGDLVHWDWLIEVPMHRGVSFSATQYDDELARVAADHSWETPERTAGRHVLTDLDRNRLRTYGLSPSWVGSDHRDPTLFRVALQLDSDYQVFVDTPWRGRDPETLARDVCQDLTRPPQQWHASWHAIKPTLTTPPTIAGPSWHHMRF